MITKLSPKDLTKAQKDRMVKALIDESKIALSVKRPYDAASMLRWALSLKS